MVAFVRHAFHAMISSKTEMRLTLIAEDPAPLASATMALRMGMKQALTVVVLAPLVLASTASRTATKLVRTRTLGSYFERTITSLLLQAWTVEAIAALAFPA